MQILFTLYAFGAVFACMLLLCLLSCFAIDRASDAISSWVSPFAESLVASIRKKG